MLSKGQLKKSKVIDTLSEELKDAKAFVLTDYRGMTVGQSQELKAKLREIGTSFAVTKNTLLKRALKSLKIELSDETNSAFGGPTATLFIKEDEVTPLKVLLNFTKTTKIPAIKLGYFWGRFFNADEITELSKLPSKEVLYGQIVGGLSSPIYRLVQTLNSPTQKLVIALAQIRDKKQS